MRQYVVYAKLSSQFPFTLASNFVDRPLQRRDVLNSWFLFFLNLTEVLEILLSFPLGRSNTNKIKNEQHTDRKRLLASSTQGIAVDGISSTSYYCIFDSIMVHQYIKGSACSQACRRCDYSTITMKSTIITSPHISCGGSVRYG